MADMRVKLSGVEFKNPIIPASGTFGFGYEFADYYDINCLGGISVKGTTYDERFGNTLPRIAETPSGMLNAIGLQNPGIHAVLDRELPELRKHYSGVIIANISGFSIDKYAKSCRLANESSLVDIIELNISCPNVHGGGMSFGASSDMAAKVTEAVRKACTKPLYIKLSPNVTDISSIAKACENAGADGISLINTLLGMRIDIHKRKPILANKTGGLSGPAIFPVALRLVWQVYEAVNIPIIGMGGISSAEDAMEMILAGASCVQIGAANLVDPFASRDIAENLEKLMDKKGIDSLESIIGGAH